jgi:hypothetical protein
MQPHGRDDQLARWPVSRAAEPTLGHSRLHGGGRRPLLRRPPNPCVAAQKAHRYGELGGDPAVEGLAGVLRVIGRSDGALSALDNARQQCRAREPIRRRIHAQRLSIDERGPPGELRRGPRPTSAEFPVGAGGNVWPALSGPASDLG